MSNGNYRRFIFCDCFTLKMKAKQSFDTSVNI
jgi:hypothetical protein